MPVSARFHAAGRARPRSGNAAPATDALPQKRVGSIGVSLDVIDVLKRH